MRRGPTARRGIANGRTVGLWHEIDSSSQGDEKIPGHFKSHHLRVAVQDIQEALLAYRELFGYEPVSDCFDIPSRGLQYAFSAAEATT
jgi:hypothetical protein